MEDSPVDIRTVEADSSSWRAVYGVAERLDQARYVAAREEHVDERFLLGAFDGQTCVGFLRFVVQVIGREEGRPPVRRGGEPLREGYVEAFGVLPGHRRRGIGQALQERAIALCRERGCYQIRSRSPVSSRENYALKLKMNYALHPSVENDSYYFIKTL